ncbi:MAG: VPLPA-CTERM-specific exosortase XrtD [Acidobacteriota bacterium]
MKRATVVALLGASFAFLFRDVLVKLVHDWASNDNYSHGFLVVPLAVYVAWRDRAHLAARPSTPSAAGLLLVIVSLLTLGVGTIGAELFLTRVALVGTMAGTVLFLWGASRLRQLSFPFLLLALAIPIPEIIFNQVTFPLQLLASRFGEFAIAACQIPVLREGNVITLATTSLEVVEACSGIRSLVSLLTLALMWGYLSGSPMWLRWLLAVSAVPVAIFANGIRVAGTGIAAHFIGPAAAEGFLHSFSGWMLFIVAGVLLLAVDRVARWVRPVMPIPVDGTDRAALAPVASRVPNQDEPFIRRGIAVSICLVIAAFGLGAATRVEATPLRESLTAFPRAIGPWEARDNQALEPRIIALLGVDDYVNRSYESPGQARISLYVGYYQSQRQGQTMHSPLSCMPGAGWDPVRRGRVALPASTGGGESGPVELNELIVQKGLDRLLVLYWYQSHGRIVASEYWGKIYTVVDAIRLNRTDAALVRVLVPISSADVAGEQAARATALDFVGRLLPVLAKHLAV